MELAPIALFAYNRPEHTKLTVEALLKNTFSSKSDLFIFSDAPKKSNDIKFVEQVRKYIKQISGFKKIKIIERDKNIGLANSIITGATDIINEYKKIIVVEDDLITSKHFLTFINNALNFYKKNSKIFSVTGYNYPESLLKIPENYKEEYYLCYRCHSWGWGTWLDRWEKVDWDIKDYNSFINNEVEKSKFERGGCDMSNMLSLQINKKIDSWAIRFCYAHYKNGSYCLYPTQSTIENIGFDGSGVHCKFEDKYKTNLNDNLYEKITFDKDVKVNKELMNNFKEIFKNNCGISNLSLLKKIKKKIGKLIKKL